MVIEDNAGGLHLVLRLPMRDGNVANAMNGVTPGFVLRLPMRDGNHH